ncbi:hypothetical protein, partial [uncultured Cetobacterium sp.]|uniref:hypothetical protein n=1 Tax=uncultured Cetobacterium sp. TaxID=527638 RepID=UPI0026029B76
LTDSTWEKSEIEIYFSENANEIKQGRFYSDRNDFKKILTNLTVSETEHDTVEEIEIIEPNRKINVTKEMIEKILNLMPNKAKILKTMPKTIKEAIEVYGYDKVKQTSSYMKKNKVEKVRAYFLKALENNWVEDMEEDVVKQPNIAQKQVSIDFTSTNKAEYNEELYIQFERLSIEIQNGIETYAYRDYIKKCGIETKIQQLAFMGSRKKYICEYLEKYPEILGNTIKEKIIPKINRDEIFIDREKLKKYIDDYIKIFSDLLGTKISNEDELKKKIIFEIMKKFMEKSLKPDDVDIVIKNNLI